MQDLPLLARGFGASLVALSLCACGTTDGYTKTQAWQGKVWRGVIVQTVVDTTFYQPSADMVSKTHLDAHRDIGLRLARVHFSTGWDSVLASAAVPDNIDFADIRRGAVVDVVTVPGPETDYATRRFTRIIRIVCTSRDDACIDKEKAAGRYNAVLDDHSVDQSYGLTFDRRATKDDVRLYD